MLVKISPPSIEDSEKTYLTSPAANGQKALAVQSNDTFAKDNFITIGAAGIERSEIKKLDTIAGTLALATTVNLSYDHPSNTPIYLIRYDKVKVYSSATEAGTFTEISGSPFLIDIESPVTVIEDATGTATTWYKTSYYNSQTTTESSKTNAMQGSGPKRGAVSSLIKRVRTDHSITNDITLVTDDEIIDWFNECLDVIQSQKNWPLSEDSVQMSTVASQNAYTVPEDTLKIKGIKLLVGTGNYYPRYLSMDEFLQRDNLSPAAASDNPEYYAIWDNQIYLRPMPATAITNGLTIYRYAKLPYVTDGNDVPAVSQPEVLVFYANMMIAIKKTDNDQISLWKGLFGTQLANMVRTAGGTKQMDRFNKTKRGTSGGPDFRITAGTPS